jgi:hypothetical protein
MQLQYVLVVNDDGDDRDATPFQGWNPAVTTDNFTRILHLLCCLPSTLKEITLTQQELLEHRRIYKRRNLMVVGAGSLPKISFVGEQWLTIFLCLPAEVSAVKRSQNLIKDKFLVLSPTTENNVVDIRNFTFPLCHSLDDLLWQIIPTKFKDNLTLRERYTEVIEIPILHGVVMPNQVLLESLGYIVKGKEGVILDDHKFAVDAIIRTADLLLDLIFQTKDEPGEIIIYTPSAKAFFYDFKSNLWNSLFREVKEKWKRQFIEEIFRAKSFSTLEIKVGDTRPTNPYKEPYLREILSTRQSETAATSMAVATLSNTQNVPSLRLPNSVNLHASKLRHIETLTKRSDRKAATLLQKAFREYVAEIKNNIGQDTAYLISQKTGACTVCSDIPLEWVYFDKLPLMISHEVSKIPMTPGNSILKFAGMGHPLTVEASALNKVLVVRSFRDGDPIKPMLEYALRNFPLSEKFDIKIVDVRNEADAINALNEFDGYITVFDCHGSHGGQESFGWLEFGDDKTNTWTLAHRARVTPITMLSACSTAPISGSHISVANGLLHSGALSVIGTFLPVNGAKSAVFIARILYRIDAFLPALKSIGFDIITWRTLISDFMQMSYTTDVLNYFVERSLIKGEDSYEINLEVNELINTRVSEWYEILIKKVSLKSGVPEAELEKIIAEENPLMETMYYCQFGTPEDIRILLRSPEEIAQKAGG